MAATEVIRIRVEPEVKDALNSMYKAKGTTISQVVRSFLLDDLQKHSGAVDRFDAIMSSADQKVAASGTQTPSIESIVEYVDRIRTERMNDACLSS